MPEPKNEWERQALTRYREAQDYLVLLDAANAAHDAMPNSAPRQALGAALEAHAEKARQARQTVKRYEDELREEELAAQKRIDKAAAISEEDVPIPKGENRRCHIHVFSGARHDIGGHQCGSKAKVIRPVHQAYGGPYENVQLCARHQKDTTDIRPFDPHNKWSGHKVDFMSRGR